MIWNCEHIKTFNYKKKSNKQPGQEVEHQRMTALKQHRQMCLTKREWKYDQKLNNKSLNASGGEMQKLRSEQWDYYKKNTEQHIYTTTTTTTTKKIPVGRLLKNEDKKVMRTVVRLRCNFGDLEEYLTAMKKSPKRCTCGDGSTIINRQHVIKECPKTAEHFGNISTEELLFGKKGIVELVEAIKACNIKA
ncbi:unnamed protein product [Ambrosiozyma monospora]|uniref:Unnamed protein product n=1 Tax=Ambrosiozyma monospora TaxID=43982 RepID=A0A9W7DGD4_AMBMO|nr:unnamed protein product [Ambrosiozyma monospora]